MPGMSWLTKIPLLGRFFRKSRGERELVAMLPHFSSIPVSWLANRHELVSQGMHGWTYIAINAIAESVAEMTPKVAVVKSEAQVTAARKQFLKGTRHNKRLRRQREQRFAAKFLSDIRRKKAMVSELQAGDELEPVPTDHRLVRLLNKPNPRDNWWTFAYRLIFFIRSAGGAYIRVVPGNDGQPAELWVIPPQWVRPIMGDGKLIESYEIRASLGGGDMSAGWLMAGVGKVTWPASEVIQLGYPHPFSLTDFLSPLTAGDAWVDIGVSIDRSRVARFQNGSFPGIVIEIDKDISNPDQATIDRLKADISAKYASVRRTGEPVILGAGISMVSVDKTPVEMDWVNSANQNADWLMALHKTGKSVVGMAENTTFASMAASRANFFQTAIRSPLKLISATLSADLCPRFNEDGLTLYFEDPTPADPTQRLTELNAQFDRGIITPNEYRTEIGLEPFAHGGDDPMVPMGLSPMGLQSGFEAEELPISAAEAAGNASEGGEDTAAPEGEPATPDGFGLGMAGKSVTRNSFNRFKALPVVPDEPPPVTKKHIDTVGKRLSDELSTVRACLGDLTGLLAVKDNSAKVESAQLAKTFADLQREIATVKDNAAKPRTVTERILRDPETGLYAGKEMVES